MASINVYFSLGSNLGDRQANIVEALRRMDLAFGSHYSSLSGILETDPVGFSGGKFLNAAVMYRLPLPPALRQAQGQEKRPACRPSEEHALWILDRVKEIEREMGRKDSPEYDEAGRRIYHSRIIDIDILFYGKEVIDLPRLTIPHKGIADRPFVMVPLLEIAKPALKRDFPEYFLEKDEGYE